MYSHDVLPHEEVVALVKRAKVYLLDRSQATEEHKQALDKLISHNIRLVAKIASRYANENISIDDLISEGVIGLIESIRRFDPDRGLHLSTYATFWIRSAIQRALGYYTSVITLSAETRLRLIRLEEIRRQFFVENGREPTINELIKISGLRGRRINRIRNITGIVKYDSPRSEKSKGTLIESIKPRGQEPVEDEVAQELLIESLVESLDNLEEPYQSAIRMHFGLPPYEHPHSHPEIAEALGIPRSSVGKLISASYRLIRQRIGLEEDEDEL